MKKLIKLGLIIAGATALTFTMVNASGDAKPETTKCQSGKSDSGKCGSNKGEKKETNTTKPAPKKGKCGTGKCG